MQESQLWSHISTSLTKPLKEIMSKCIAQQWGSGNLRLLDALKLNSKQTQLQGNAFITDLLKILLDLKTCGVETS